MCKSDLLRLVRVMMVALALMLPLAAGAQNVTLNLRDVTVQEAVTQLQS